MGNLTGIPPGIAHYLALYSREIGTQGMLFNYDESPLLTFFLVITSAVIYVYTPVRQTYKKTDGLRDRLRYYSLSSERRGAKIKKIVFAFMFQNNE